MSFLNDCSPIWKYGVSLFIELIKEFYYSSQYDLPFSSDLHHEDAASSSCDPVLWAENEWQHPLPLPGIC